VRLPRRVIAPVASLVGLVVLWELAVDFGEIPRFLLPPPSAVVAYTYENIGLLSTFAVDTLLATLAGFALAMSIGVAIAVAIVWSPTFEDATYPIIVVTQVMPKVAIAPLLVVYLGFEMAPKIFLAFLVSFFPVVINTTLGLKSISVELTELLATLGARKWQVMVKVRLWRAVPYIVEGAKIAITLAVIGAIIGEFSAGNQGLGYLITSAASNLDTTLGFSALLLLVLIGVLLFELIDIGGRLLTPWLPKSQLDR
jgi:NitT/TauT family transport system permease protein